MNSLSSFSLTFSHLTSIEPSLHSMTSEQIWNIVKNDVVISQEIIQSFSLLLQSQDFNPFEINPSEGMSLLHQASLRGKTEIIRCILYSSRFSIEEIQELINHQCHHYQSTALNYACFWGHSDIFMLLVGAGASIHIKDKHGTTSLHLAMRNSNPVIVSELIRISENDPSYLNAQDDVNGSTALHMASMVGNVAMVHMLIASGAQIDILDRHGNTPLQDAAAHGQAEAYWMLIVSGSPFRESDIPLVVSKGHAESFIRVGLDQLLMMSKLLETLPSTKENQIAFISFNRILCVFSQILNLQKQSPLQNAQVIFLSIRSILSREIITNWLQSILVRCEKEFAEIRSLTYMTRSISCEQVDSLSTSVENFDELLTHFNQSLKSFSALSPPSLSTSIFSFQLRRNFICRWISEFPKAYVDFSMPSSSSSSSFATPIPQPTIDLILSKTPVTSTSGTDNLPSKPQRAREKRDRMFVSTEGLGPIKKKPAPGNRL